MAEAYLDQRDLDKRLGDTICTWEGTPVYVATHYDRVRHPNIALFKLNGELYKPWKTVDHKSPLFCDRSLPLGYMNYNKNAYYLQRVPFRHQNQAIKANCIETTPVLSRNEQWFTSEAMHNCLINKYISMGDAWKALGAGHLGAAIHRDIALRLVDSRSTGLYYKTRLVALWSEFKGDWDWITSSDMTYLQKIISRLGVL